MSKSARPDDDVATIGDLRHLYRLVLRTEERLCAMHSLLHMMNADMIEDRKRLNEIIALLTNDEHWQIRQ